jgi:hypothetical protein
VKLYDSPVVRSAEFTAKECNSQVRGSGVDRKLLLLFFLDPDPASALISDPISDPDRACL